VRYFAFNSQDYTASAVSGWLISLIGTVGTRFDVLSSAVYNRAVIRLEQVIFAQELASSGQLYVYQTTRFWSQIKSAG